MAFWALHLCPYHPYLDLQRAAEASPASPARRLVNLPVGWPWGCADDWDWDARLIAGWDKLHLGCVRSLALQFKETKRTKIHVHFATQTPPKTWITWFSSNLNPRMEHSNDVVATRFHLEPSSLLPSGDRGCCWTSHIHHLSPLPLEITKVHHGDRCIIQIGDGGMGMRMNSTDHQPHVMLRRIAQIPGEMGPTIENGASSPPPKLLSDQAHFNSNHWSEKYAAAVNWKICRLLYYIQQHI